jgi:hypothetical protein
LGEKRAEKKRVEISDHTGVGDEVPSVPIGPTQLQGRQPNQRPRQQKDAPRRQTVVRLEWPVFSGVTTHEKAHSGHDRLAGCRQTACVIAWMRSRERSSRENRRFSSVEKRLEDFFHGL